MTVVQKAWFRLKGSFLVKSGCSTLSVHLPSSAALREGKEFTSNFLLLPWQLKPQATFTVTRLPKNYVEKFSHNKQTHP
ncbi:uncharacterized [Tachysurus ichikawai]